MHHFAYYAPTSIGEAVALLHQHAGQAKILAGGTDLFLRLQRRAVMPSVVIDVKRIPALGDLRYRPEDGLHLGATVTHAMVVEHPAVQQHYGALAQAAQWVGSLQTRHRGTVVGNLCNASPAADTAPALLAYGALVRMTGPEGERELPLEAFLQGPGRTALGAAEMVTALHLPPPGTSTGWGYARRTRTVMDIALVSTCAVLQASHGVCQVVRIGLGAVGPTPLRATQAEAVLQGQRPDVALVAEASRLAAAAARPITDIRASAAYRQEMVQVLSQRCLTAALRMLQLL